MAFEPRELSSTLVDGRSVGAVGDAAVDEVVFVLHAVSRLRSPGITGKHIGKATLSMAERKPKSTTLTEAGVSYRIADEVLFLKSCTKENT
jgi:hypothetical protein